MPAHTNPERRITIRPAGGRVRITAGGAVLADTTEALRLEELDYPAVYYVPRKDVRMERLARSTHRTHCPFKGDASYYSLKDGAENMAWSYEQPLEAVREIREHLAFYPSKVDAIDELPG